MTRIFSWRDHAIVEMTVDVDPEFANVGHPGWRVNYLDTVFGDVDSAIVAIEASIRQWEEHYKRPWHAEDNQDLICVPHNCLYWQCGCGKSLGLPDKEARLVNYLATNLGQMIQQNQMSKVDELGTPYGIAEHKMQVGNCEPLQEGPHEVNGLIVELFGGVRFKVRIEVVK